MAADRERIRDPLERPAAVLSRAGDRRRAQGGREPARPPCYQRIRLLENIAVAAAITLAGTFTYGFLETAGFPKVSMFWVWIGMGVSTGAVTFMRKVLDR